MSWCHDIAFYVNAWGPFLTSPLAPRGEICPLGGMFTPSFTPRGEHSLLVRRMEGRTENFIPQGITTPPGDTVHPWGTSSSLGSKFAPWGEVKNGPLDSLFGVKSPAFEIHSLREVRSSDSFCNWILLFHNNLPTRVTRWVCIKPPKM
jgi:hypothetical protein